MKKYLKILLLNIILLLTILILFPNISVADDWSYDHNSGHEPNYYTEQGDTTSLTYGSNIIGKTIGFSSSTETPNKEELGLFDKYDHIYCLEHEAYCQTGLYKVTNYVNIRGNLATGYYEGGVSHNGSIWNETMLYLLCEEDEDFEKWYEHQGTRDKAIHDYFQDTWYTKVGSGLGISSSWHSGEIKNDSAANAFIERAKNHSSNSDTPNISCNQTKILYDNYEDNTYLEQIDVFYTGEIESITALDSNNKAISGITIYDCIKNKNITDISKIGKSNYFGSYESSFKIKKNSDTTEIKEIIVQLKSQTVNEADMWFLEMDSAHPDSGPSQRLVVVETYPYDVDASVSITVEKKGSLTINKRDENTGKLIAPNAAFKIRKNAGNGTYKWVRGRQNITYVDSPDNAGIYYTENGTLTLYNLDSGTYVVYEIEAPTGYDLKSQDNYDANNPVVQCEAVMYTDTNGNNGIRIQTDDVEIDMYNKRGSLIIIKKDEYDKNTILNAGFMIKTNEGWLRGGTPESNYTYSYNASPSEATIYRTSDSRFRNDKGNLQLRALDNKHTYTVYEVEAPEGYVLKYQANYIENEDSAKRDVVVCKKDGNDSFAINNEDVELEVFNTKVGDITIFKRDYENHKNLTGVGYKIRTTAGANTWLAGTIAPYKYDASFEEATTYYVEDNRYGANDDVEIVNDSENGKGVKIKNIKDGEYRIYEVDPPEGYYLEDQDGLFMDYYGNQIKAKYENGIVDTGVTFNLPTPSGNGGTVLDRDLTSVLVNLKRASVSGYVWLDKVPNNKKTDTNNLWDTDEEKISGVIVNLYEKGKTEPIATTQTVDGKYEFKEVIKRTIDKIYFENYYVEFDYSSLEQFKDKYKDSTGRELTYIKYIPVAFNAVENGSKAVVKAMPEHEKDIIGIATTYTGTGDETKENTYGLAKCGNYNIETQTLENINLGIKEIPKQQFDITENIATVTITMKGFTYTYVYGGERGENRIYAPTVKYQGRNDITAYRRSFYPSDIVYDKKNSKEELKAEVKYRIDIKNTENMNMEFLYKEKSLYLKQLVNKFDTSRYTLNDTNWVGNGDTATITSDYLNTICDKTLGITPNENKTAYINFSVNHDAILDILNHPEGIIEEFPTKATAIAYHKYTRNDYSWDNNILNEQTHYSIDDIRDAEAPYLIFELGEDREISGKVFEDSVVENDNGEKLGNGRNEANENNTKDVIVELIDTDNDEIIDFSKDNVPVSNLYRAKKYGNNAISEISEPAVVKTNEYGGYSLAGIVPGYYYLRFTYGDGSQKICDVHGNEIKTVVSKDYKSTIVTSEKAKTALKDKNSLTWYINLEAENYSVAIDSINIRKEINKANKNNVIADLTEVNGQAVQSGENINTNEEQKTMYAGTAKMLLNYEVDGTEAKEINVDNGKQSEIIKNEIKGINFGIIEQPVNKALIEKVITYVTLTTAQNNVVFDGNPETIDMQGVSDLDNKENGGSIYVRAEVIEDIIYSSKLELVYEVKVKNLSDVNYYTEDYYLYGDKGKVVTLKVTNAKDYLDEALKYLPEKSSQDKIDKTIGKETLDKNTLNSRNTQVLTLNNWKHISRNEEDIVTITAERNLSKADKDMEIVNEAEIIDIKRADEDGNIDEEKLSIVPSEIHVNGRVKVVTNITPPTGKNKMMIIYYVIAGIVTLILLSVGIVILKKKIK